MFNVKLTLVSGDQKWNWNCVLGNEIEIEIQNEIMGFQNEITIYKLYVKMNVRSRNLT